MRAQPYLRAVPGHGLTQQRRATRNWARAGGIELADEIVDADTGASPSPSLLEAVRLACRRDADGLVVASLDCLSGTVAVQEAALWRLHGAGARLWSASEGDAAALLDDPQRAVVRDAVAVAMAFDEAARGALRARKAEQSGHAYGRPPFGYKAVHGELVPDEAEQATFARIRELHEAGESLRSIAGSLDAEGHRPKTGERWHPAPLARIIRRVSDG